MAAPSKACTAGLGSRSAKRATTARAHPQCRKAWNTNACTPGRNGAGTLGMASDNDRPCTTAATVRAAQANWADRGGRGTFMRSP